MMSRLLPCPFCDSPASLMDSSSLNKKMWWVRCDNECIEQIGFKRQEQAIRAWNQRGGIEALSV